MPAPTPSAPPAYVPENDTLTTTTTTTTDATAPRSADTASLRTLPAYTPSRWGRYATEAEYLAALRAWVEERQYGAPGEQSALVGFYGAKTMSDYAAGPGLGGDKKKGRGAGEAPGGRWRWLRGGGR
ncbi:hypothetical protein MMC15_004090 [Xylographa vitiligo]|nr:hypothetical protein [Xylographa vitiligo]